MIKQPSLRLTPQMSAADVEGWDSLVMLKLMFAVETHFGVHFKSAEMDRFERVGDLAQALLARRLQFGAAPR